jgi:hypothetical protein
LPPLVGALPADLMLPGDDTAGVHRPSPNSRSWFSGSWPLSAVETLA